MRNLLKRLSADYPNIKFTEGKSFFWSPKDNSVTYNSHAEDKRIADFSLLHEVSHGILGHTEYSSDYQLVQLEVQAWDYAKKLGKKYGIMIEPDHIEDCLDTYRDWLHRRSACPTCASNSFQTDPSTYRCLNCATTWNVSNSRFCRPYRRVAKV